LLRSSYFGRNERGYFAEYADDLKVAAKPLQAALASLRANASRVELPRFHHRMERQQTLVIEKSRSGSSKQMKQNKGVV